MGTLENSNMARPHKLWLAVMPYVFLVWGFVIDLGIIGFGGFLAPETFGPLLQASRLLSCSPPRRCNYPRSADVCTWRNFRTSMRFFPKAVM